MDDNLLAMLMKQIHDLNDKVNTLTDRQPIQPVLKIFKNFKYQNTIPLQPPSLPTEFLLITVTFDPKISINLDEIGQNLLLKRSLDELQNVEYYACFEKHKSGILHAHIMANLTTYDMEYKYGLRMLKHVSKSNKMHPAIDWKNIKRTEIDYKRSYDYILEDKKDHPIYKRYHFNVVRN